MQHVMSTATQQEIVDMTEIPAQWSRIRARLQTTPDGAKGHYGWYDGQLDIACNFYRAADDSERCLPTDWIASSGSVWADAGCSTPLAAAPIGCTPAYVYTFEQTATCSSVSGVASPYRYHVYGGVTPYTGTSYWIGSGGATGCTMEPINATNAYYTFGAEIAASTFAPGNIVTE